MMCHLLFTNNGENRKFLNYTNYIEMCVT